MNAVGESVPSRRGPSRSRRFRLLRRWPAILGALCVLSSASLAGEPAREQTALEGEVNRCLAAADDAEWHGVAAVYLWGATVDGVIRFEDSGAPEDGDLGSGFEIEWGATGHVELGQGRWRLLLDLLYVEYGSGGTVLQAPAESDIDGLVAELGATFRVWPAERDKEDSRWLVEVLAGARYADLDVDIDAPTAGIRISRGVDWLDPFVGVRARVAVGEARRFALLARGDVGGFGVGSELTWNLVLGAEYAFAERWSALLGYRWLDIDHEDRGSLGIFDLAVRLHGPWLSVAYRF